jgi:Na+:H+ antiporter
MMRCLMMDPFLQLLLALVIILPVAKGSGYLSNRLGQPAVLGELLIGLLLAPTLLDILHWSVFSDTHLGETLSHLAHLGVLLLMFIAGLEVDLKAMLHAGRPAVLAGILGGVTPIGLGMLALLPFDFGPQRGFFIGLVLAATSVSISAQTLMELGVFRSRVGGLLSAAAVDDVLVILLLSVFSALLVGGNRGILAILWVLVRMVAFLGLAFWLGARFIPRLGSLVDRLPISEGVTALAIAIILPFAPVIVVVAVLSKIVGCGVGARLGGLSRGETLRLGVGMTSRGEEGLIVATVGLGPAWLEKIYFPAWCSWSW